MEKKVIRVGSVGVGAIGVVCTSPVLPRVPI